MPHAGRVFNAEDAEELAETAEEIVDNSAGIPLRTLRLKVSSTENNSALLPLE